MIGAGGGTVVHTKDVKNGVFRQENAVVGGTLADWMVHASVIYGFYFAIRIGLN